MYFLKWTSLFDYLNCNLIHIEVSICRFKCQINQNTSHGHWTSKYKHIVTVVCLWRAVLQYLYHYYNTLYLLPVRLLLAGLAAPPRVDGGLELLQAGGQHWPALSPLLLSQHGSGQGLHWVGAGRDDNKQHTLTVRYCMTTPVWLFSCIQKTFRWCRDSIWLPYWRYEIIIIYLTWRRLEFACIFLFLLEKHQRGSWEMVCVPCDFQSKIL